jgi:hypothetical protein
MALVQVPEYVYNASTAGAPIASALSIKQIPAQTSSAGLRCSIGNAPLPWPLAATANMVTGGPDDLGLYTVGQFQCVCIAVVTYPNPAIPNWTQAWLAHASHPGHSVIQTIVNTLTVANHNQAHVVIACKLGGDWLSRISEKFKTAADANRVSVAAAQIWLYSTTDNATFSFGIRRDGVFGQVFQ